LQIYCRIVGRRKLNRFDSKTQSLRWGQDGLAARLRKFQWNAYPILSIEGVTNILRNATLKPYAVAFFAVAGRLRHDELRLQIAE
jgi:hypothetical protein